MKSFPSDSKIEKLVHGDKEVIQSLYSELFPKVSFYILKNKGTQHDAKEIFHNALFQIIVRAKVKGVVITSSFEAYIFTVCKNLWRKELNNRKKEVRNEGVFELNAKEDHMISDMVEQERWDLFEEKLTLLSDNCRALLKDFFNKVPYQAIVKKFEYSNENVAFQRMFKCKKKLAALIKSDPKYLNLLS